MKIMVPLNLSKGWKEIIRSEADEFYVGFTDIFWTSEFGEYADINRMSGFGYRANPFSFDEICFISSVIKEKGKKIFVTLNANGYTDEELGFISEKYFTKLKDFGCSGVIVPDIPMTLLSLKAGLTPIASTMCGIYNSDIAEVYYDLGVRRMILPRDLSFSEIESIRRKFPDVEFEVFLMRNGCIFSDSYCLGLHRPECGALCTYTRFGEINTISLTNDFMEKQNIELNENLYHKALFREACGLCAIYRLKEIGIDSLKIVGRADDPEFVLRDIEMVKKNIKIAEESTSEKEYLDRMIFPEGYPSICRMGLNCYYPEVRFGEV